MKYSDVVIDWLVEAGYTHCFFVAGGNIMHLLDSVRSRMECVPVVHEVAAGIAVEYFNEVSEEAKAFALVTAGPGLTNIVTALAGAYLESRELLVIGGQVKSSDLSDGTIRQRGIQEIDGVALAKPVCVATLQVRKPVERGKFMATVNSGGIGRKGPVFVEMCLDAQAAEVQLSSEANAQAIEEASTASGRWQEQCAIAAQWISAAQRPVILLGGGVSRQEALDLHPKIMLRGIPVATTWNAADRIDSSNELYFGRPNTWGMRWANVLLQQADVVIAVGTRLGMQQTGFNWQGFAPLARVVQIDIDPGELAKGHPHVELPVEADAAEFLRRLLDSDGVADAPAETQSQWEAWVRFGRDVREALPLADPANDHATSFIDPFTFAQELSGKCSWEDVVIPCSSGGAFTAMMQAFEQKQGQVMVTDKGLASMGYGLAGAIGAAIARRPSRTILVEGDGGFSQNLQELGTVVAQGLNLKVFVFANSGYASIRMTQRNYFGGAYMGCDTSTGLGMPDWVKLFDAYGMPSTTLNADKPFAGEVMELFNMPGPAAFVVPIDPEQTYYPKINSRVTDSGTMESTPLHVMFPELDDDLAVRVLPYLAGSA